MLFPVSGVETSIWIPPLVAFVISYFTSMAGLSGAILLLPFQFSVLGYTAPSVTPTNLVFNIVGIPSGVYRYFKEGRVNWPLAVTITCGALPGIFLGAVIRVTCLPDPSKFKLFAGAFLLFIGMRMIHQIIREKIRGIGLQTPTKESRASKQTQKPIVTSNEPMKTISFSIWRAEYEFLGERFIFNTFGLFCLSLVVGLLGGIYGIGGAAIIAPFILTFFKLPVHTVAGATLISACVTSVAGVLFYEFLGPSLAPSGEIRVSPDWMLGCLFGVGGLVGMYLGAATQKYVSGSIIRLVLAALISSIGLNYVFMAH